MTVLIMVYESSAWREDMILHRHVEAPCPSCGLAGSHGALFVSNKRDGDCLVMGCKACGKIYSTDLPPIRKTVVYLDQFFLSSAFRGKDGRFVDAAARISDMASRQLLICPWSSTHELETHLWEGNQQQALWDFIKRTAGGKKFNYSDSIKSAQMSEAFRLYLDGRDPSSRVVVSHAFSSDVHSWDGFMWVDIDRLVEDIPSIRSAKVATAQALVGLFDGWVNKPMGFDSDVREEAGGTADAMLKLYLDTVAQFGAGMISAVVNMTNEAGMIQSMLLTLGQDVSIGKRLERVIEFLRSEYFFLVPWVNASCRAIASLRKAVRDGEFANREKAVNELSGFFYDIDVVSIYAPYCDGVFLDRAMHRWIGRKECSLEASYKFSAFSVANLEAFHGFLDSIEASQSKDHGAWLATVYGRL